VDCDAALSAHAGAAADAGRLSGAAAMSRRFPLILWIMISWAVAMVAALALLIAVIAWIVMP
jgi:hypothetical protein